ncbi:MAG: hypothetical protein ACLUDY_12725 [Bacteroides xylanisolvens]
MLDWIMHPLVIGKRFVNAEAIAWDFCGTSLNEEELTLLNI